MSDTLKSADANKSIWVEPTIRVLDVEETFNANGRGADGNAHADCTRS